MINIRLEIKKKYTTNKIITIIDEEPSQHNIPSMKYEVLLVEALLNQDKIIQQLEEKFQINEKSKTA